MQGDNKDIIGNELIMPTNEISENEKYNNKLNEKSLQIIDFLRGLANYKLAPNEHLMARTKDVFNKVYSNSDYRHFYSEISQYLDSLYIESYESSENLMNCLGYIDEHKRDLEDDHVLKFLKLYDHIKLEDQRAQQKKEIFEEIEKTKEILFRENKQVKLLFEQELELANIELEKTRKRVADDINEEIKDVQKSYITILGIFASIVIAFVSGITFSTSILQYMGGVSIHRMLGVGLGIAFVLINIIYMLARFIQEINKKKNEKVKYPIYMGVINSVILLGFVLNIIYWIKFCK